MDRRELIQVLTSRISVLTPPHPVRVAIDGVDAAGKTTLADELAPSIEALGRPVIRASIDGFHHPAAIRRQRDPLSPEGYFEDSFNEDALLDVLIRPLGPGGSHRFRRSVFDFRTDRAVDAPLEYAAPNAILLLDGVFLLRPRLRQHFEFSIYVDSDFRTTLTRAERRDVTLFGSVEEVRRRYLERYIPGQQLYLRRIEPKRWATVVVDNNDPLQPTFVQVVQP